MPPTLELSMIVRNGAASLERCLASVAGTVDRILIGDTGSTDRTSEIAVHYGAELIPIPWNDDFAEARNQVLSRSVCDWILVLDADEMLAPEARAALPALIRDPSAWAYDLWRWNYVQDLGYRSGGEQALVNPGHLEAARRYPAYFRTDHTRLFRRDPRIRFEHCVHESVVESLDAAHLPRRRAGIVIHHFGYVDDAEQIRGSKDELYHRLVRRKLAQAPHSYQAHLEAGIAELDYAKNPATALPHFTRASELAPTMQAAWLYRGVCLTRLARYAEALADLKRAALLSPSNPLVHSATADVFFQTGDYQQARQAYLRARQLGDRSPLTYAKLGASEVQAETQPALRKQGLLKVQQAANENPNSGELLDILATTALLAGQPQSACEAANRRLSTQDATGFHFLLAATIHQHAGDPAKAGLILNRGLVLFPHDAQLKALAAAQANL